MAGSHWTVASIVLALDVVLVVCTVLLDRLHHTEPPAGGATDVSAPIGWLGVVSAIMIFGCYGILIKTPAVTRAKVDAMIFQCYYGAAVAFVSMLIWAFAGSHAGITFTVDSFAMGLLFGALWVSSQICAFHAIQIMGYAVGPAVWIGLTICTSFLWGTAAFGNPVANIAGAITALVMLVAGVCMMAGSSHLSDQRQQRAREVSVGATLQLASSERLTQEQDRASGKDDDQRTGAGRILFGLLSCAGVGITNGSLMVPMRCFDQGCESIGIKPYTGDLLAPLAFLPSLAAGILVVTPVFFVFYFCRTLASRRWPEFHFRVAALPGFLTGLFWGMGNFNAMFATVYLGQTIGYPLTQCCLIISGCWGILYYKEISGAAPIGLFILATAVIVGGATLDGMFG